MNIENKCLIITCENNKAQLSGVMTLDFAKEESKKYFQDDNAIITIMEEDKFTGMRTVVAKRENGEWINF